VAAQALVTAGPCERAGRDPDPGQPVGVSEAVEDTLVAVPDRGAGSAGDGLPSGDRGQAPDPGGGACRASSISKSYCLLPPHPHTHTRPPNTPLPSFIPANEFWPRRDCRPHIPDSWRQFTKFFRRQRSCGSICCRCVRIASAVHHWLPQYVGILAPPPSFPNHSHPSPDYAGNDERYVLWKLLMPSFLQLLLPSDGVTVGECLVIAASTLADVLCWARNPAYLPAFYEHLHQFVRQSGMVRAVGGLPAFTLQMDCVWLLLVFPLDPLVSPVRASGVQRWFLGPSELDQEHLHSTLAVRREHRSCQCLQGRGTVW
jgi:hypothetical protein